MSVRIAHCASALIVGASLASAQVPTKSWDAPRNASATIVSDGVEVVRGEIIVGLRDWTCFGRLAVLAGVSGDVVLGGIPSLRAVHLRVGAGDVKAAVGRYRLLPYVAYAEPNAISEACEDNTANPNDPYYPSEWHLNNTGQNGGKPDADIDAPEGWAVADGSEGVVVAVVDTGINFQQPEFQGRLLPGWDFVDEDGDPTGLGHGILVTGILAADADNGFEVAGIDHRCKILPIKVGNEGGGTVFDLAQGIDFAAAEHAAVINLSLEYIGSSDLIHDAVIEAFTAGCIQVAAAGNTSLFGSADKHVPAKYPEVMSVGWTNNLDHRVFDSATGNTLDFVAPGDHIWTVTPTGAGSKMVVSGSSAASPVVSGTAAVMLGLNPHLSFSQVYDLLRLGAEDQVGDPAEDTPGWDPYYGWGRVNLRRSLEALCGCQGGESLIASPQQASVAAGEVVALRVDAGREHAGQPYWIFGTASGAGAWSFGPLTLPLTFDDYTRFAITDANGPILVKTHGVLDDAGQAMGFVMLPTSLSLAAPATLNHVAVVFDGHASPAHAILATNVTTTLIEP